MAFPGFKRFRGYIAPFLLTYTVLVTFLLVQTAWNDGASVRKARAKDQPTAHRYVPTKEERRHLRSLEDVDGIGNVALNRRDRSLTNYGRQRSAGLQNGRKVQSSLSNDFYVDEIDNVTAEGNNGTGIGANFPPGGRDYILESRLHQFRPDAAGRRKFEGGGTEESVIVESQSSNEKQSQHTNIEIEEMLPDVDNDAPSINSTKPVLKFRHHSFRDKKAGDSSSLTNAANRSAKGPHSQNNGLVDTQFCDNIEHDGRLCYRDRVIHSHPNHVNISSTHQSFRSFGGLFIYSAFLDTRLRPAAIRVITVGPKGYQNGGSSLWCAFSSSMAVSRRYRWTGQVDTIANGRTQATQMYFYTASDGHDRAKQFYVMSCDVPDAYVNTLVRFDGNRIDIVAGTQNSALLDTIQERIPITVINNKGLPWHILKEQASARTTKPVPYAGVEKSQGQSEQGLNGEERSDIRRVNNWIEKSSSISRNISQLGDGNPLLADQSAAALGAPNGTKDSKAAYVGPPGSRDAIVSCVAPVYGLNGIVQITEFIEMTLLLGVQHIVFYTFQVSADVRQILNMYKQQGLVTVLPWNVPDANNIWAKGRDVALNDCLYRTMFRYDFVLFHDVDEFLVPRATPDLPSLIGFLRTKGRLNTTRISDIVFNSAYFSPPTKVQATNLTTMAGYTKDVPKLITLRSLHRTYFTANHTLRIIKPVAAMRVGAGERKRTTFYINPRFAGVNHYAKCPNAASPPANAPFSKSGPRDNHDSSKNGPNSVDCVHTKWDDVIWKYKDKLIQNTKDSIRAFNAQGGVRR